MATNYYLTTTASDLSVPGDNFDNEISESVPGTTTLAVQIAKSKSESDHGYSVAGNPGADGTSGDFTVTVEINTGVGTTTLDIALARINSGGTVQSGPVSSDGGSQAASAGTKTYSFTAPALGTWAAGDRLRVDFNWNNTVMTNADITQDIGSAGTRLSAPWGEEEAAENAVFFSCNF